MPIFEYRCVSCERFSESYLTRWDDPNPACGACGGQQVRQVSTFNAPFSGSIHKYTDPKKENSHMDGWWAYRKVSSVSGQPEPCYISTMAELKAFNAAEGLAAPGEVPTNCTITADGRSLNSNGMPGQWSLPDPTPGLPKWAAEATTARTSLHGKDPEYTPSGPPCTIEAVDTSDAAAMAQFQQSAGQG